MPVSRRGFFRFAGPRPTAVLSGAFLAARGLEAHLAEAAVQGARARPLVPPGAREIRISSNENPLGPGRAVLDAIVGKFPEAGRYPFNSTPADRDLAALIASKHGTKPDTIVLGVGSQEILKNSVRAFTTPARGLVTASPSFENCPNTAKKVGHPITEIKVDSALRLDLDAMIAASAGAGLVFFCNPNNPTATVHGATAVADFVERVRRASPDTVILIDEAYHDYVTDPSYRSAVPLALETPNVVVSRTFSKAHGMAGLRVGYGIGRADTIKRLAAFRMPYNVSVPAIIAAITSLNDQKHIDDERSRNTEVRAFTGGALRDLGCKVSDSQTNFLFVDIGRPARDFRAACARLGVMVGRDFPPFEKSHARISIGTMDEMRKATDAFRTVLRNLTTTAAVGKE
ncbi:MAG TPA: histidinol-phosphate transaminase [Vicinamibacterales bacterium]|nr:histidinol-phosphate transaminase [Vicinamibacterales bacterium]